MKSELQDRINRVINTSAFSDSLSESGVELFDFQIEFAPPNYRSFEDLPEFCKKAILAGEIELSRNHLTAKN